MSRRIIFAYKKRVGLGAFVATLMVISIAEMFSIPAGIYTAIETGSIFHGLASFFVPMYGIIYTIIHYVF